MSGVRGADNVMPGDAIAGFTRFDMGSGATHSAVVRVFVRTDSTESPSALTTHPGAPGIAVSGARLNCKQNTSSSLQRERGVRLPAEAGANRLDIALLL